MKPEHSNDVWIYENERNIPLSSDSGEVDKPNSNRVKKHFTDSEQRSYSFDADTKEQAQRAPITENEATIFMHSSHELDQDSMLQNKSDDIIPRESKEPANSFHIINSATTFGNYNDKNTSYRGYPTTISSKQHKSEQILSRSDQNSDQNCFNSSASSQNNDAGYTKSASNKPYKHLTHQNIGGSSDNDALHYSADDRQSLQVLRTCLKNSPPSANENLESNRDDVSSKAADAPLTDRSDSMATDKRSQMLQTYHGQNCSCSSHTNYVIVKVSPAKVTHNPYDVPTRSQSLLNKAIQTAPSYIGTPDSANSGISNQRPADSKYKPNKPQPIYSPYDVLTLGQTIMKDATENSLQKNDSSHNMYDVPTKAQFLLQEAATSLSLKDTLTSSYNAITDSILSIPIEAPPSPEDSDNESPIESGASKNVPAFKERLPLTYALDASNRAFSYINNGYPPSPKTEEKEEEEEVAASIHDISALDDRPPSAKIKLESIEGNTIGVQRSENEICFLSDKMPGSYDFFDELPITSEPESYYFLPISRISEKEEPAIHGQSACYTTSDIVQPESTSFRHVSKSARMNDIEPSIHGQSPSFYPGETPKSSRKRFPINRSSESKGKTAERHALDDKIQDDKYNKRRDILNMYHGNQGILEETYRPLQQYEKVKPTGEKLDVSDMSMAIPVPEKIDVDDFSFKIQKPEERDQENEELAYNEVLVPVEFDEDKVDEIHSEQVETVKIKNSFFKKISLTPQQALRFYSNHSTLIDLALATNPAGAAFVVAKDVNQQRLINKKARAERAAEMLAHPERFIEEVKPQLTFTERLKNAPKGAVKIMNENQGYINAALAASPGGKALDAARIANKYARRGLSGYTQASSIHTNGFKKASETFALDNLKSYTDPFIPNMSIPNSFHVFNPDSISSYIPGYGSKKMNTESDIPMSESPSTFNHAEYFMGSSVNNNNANSSINYRTMSSGVLSPISQEDSTFIETSELPYKANPFATKNTKVRQATIDSIATKQYGQTPQEFTDPIIESTSITHKTDTGSTSREYGGTPTNIPEPNTRAHESRTKYSADPVTAKQEGSIRIITDPATMKTYTLYNRPCRRNYSESNLKKTVNFNDSKNTLQNGSPSVASSKQRKPKLHGRPYSTPVMKDSAAEECYYNQQDLSSKTNVREVPMKKGSIFVPIEAFDNASFTTYISGHFENRKGSFQKTMGRLVQNDKMKDNGDRMKLSGKTKIKAYQFKRKTF